MIGKPEWFKYRMMGWGISPKTWQGWVYVATIALLLGATYSMTINTALMFWAFGIILGIVILDTIHIMIQLPKFSDERENYHQLIIERNCSFAAITALIILAMYQTYQNKEIVATMTVPFDYSILIVLGAMLGAKILSTIYVKVKM